MDVADYRREYEAQLEQAADRVGYRDRVARAKPAAGGRFGFAEADAAEGDDVAAALAVLDDGEAAPSLQIDALRVVSAAVGDRPELIDRLLAILRDEAAPIELRRATLTALEQASFQMATLPGTRPAYMDALRALADDEDRELRERAVEILARERDEYVQRRLLEGLEDRSRALVPPAKAIQLLGYDVHAEYFPLLRRIVAQPPSRAAKEEAVRLLAADPTATGLLTEILNDKNERPEVRSISAVALQTLAPERFEAEARRIALDDAEDDRLRAASVTALTTFAHPPATADDAAFTQRVEEVRESTTSAPLKRATARYVAKQTT